MMQCLSSLAALGVVVLALLIMTRAVRMEDAFKAFGQAFIAIMLAIWVICLLWSLLPTAVEALKAVAVWLAIIALAIIGIALVARASRNVWRRAQHHSNPGEDQGEDHE